ncbi:hypothetical protein [uncultured Salinisphaera sp.]|uniref:hypothetical protein n=1 Tax=uncultured Salinisphaera sp. TaxID=359372 RepID=UPI0032B27554|tara:strand:+ start:2718 stop:3020 length:303 start_codon:yes stop_codon:yes gene_type:complete
MNNESPLLSLLQFSLDKKGISTNEYLIGELGDEKKTNDSLCLLANGDTWIVAYAERGIISEQSVHSSLRVAIKDFYARLAITENPWTFRAEWESKTGKQL